MTANGRLRWGVLSTARINDEVIPAIRCSSRSALLAVASRDEGRAREYASRYGIERSYGSYDALLADDDIDCVYVSVPNVRHAPVTVAALNAGKHVLCEKPLATSGEEGALLIDHATRSGCVLMEAFMYRHHDKTQTLRHLVQTGALGAVEVIRSTFHFRTKSPASDIRYRPELAGGALRDVGCYCTSLATYLVGEMPDQVAGVARLVPSGVDESFGGLLKFGERYSVFDCGMQADLQLGVAVIGTDACARVATPWYPHVAPTTIEVWQGDDCRIIETSGANPYLLEVDNFCAAVLGDGEPEVDHDETMRNLRLMDDLAVAAGLPNYQLEPEGSPQP